MCRKFILLFLVLGMVSTSYGMVIGNWETASAEGWTVTGGAVFTPNVTPGHTLGDYAGSITPASGSYLWDLVGATYNAGSLYTAADWLANNTLEFDVTRLTSEWTYSGSSQYSRMHVAMTTDVVGKGQTTVGSNLVTWYGANNNSMHVALNYTAFRTGAEAATWVKIILGTQAANWTTMGNYYIDNVQLTPEPATICLLGLGALGLLRRRRT